MGILPAAVDLNQARQVLLALGIAIHRRDHRLLALKDPDPITHHLQHNAVLLPLLEHLDIERLGTRIKIRPQLGMRLRCHAIGQRR